MRRPAEPTKKPARETNLSVLRHAAMRKLERRIGGEGQIELPCIPSLADKYVTKVLAVWEALGKPFDDGEVALLRDNMTRALADGYRVSSYSQIVVGYQTQPAPHPGIRYEIRVKPRGMDELYAEWIAGRPPPLFGTHPDAKVVALASELGEPATSPVLDVGAGTGRNALYLARRGHPATAVEPATALAAQLRDAAAAEKASVDVMEKEILADDLVLARDHFKLVILAEVLPHFRDLDQVKRLFAKLADAVSTGGVIVANAFVASDGYKPDAAMRELSHDAWSTIFSRSDLAFITDELPYSRVSDESVYDYEQAHLPPEAWPPTGWFADWSRGLNIFSLPAGKAPVELRWLVFRKL